MHSSKKIQEQVEQAMNSLDNMKRAEAPPFFYTRLMARLDSTEATIWNRSMNFLSRPAVSLGLLFLFLVMNGYLIVSKITDEGDQAPVGNEYVAQQITYFDNSTP